MLMKNSPTHASRRWSGGQALAFGCAFASSRKLLWYRSVVNGEEANRNLADVRIYMRHFDFKIQPPLIHGSGGVDNGRAAHITQRTLIRHEWISCRVQQNANVMSCYLLFVNCLSKIGHCTYCRMVSLKLELYGSWAFSTHLTKKLLHTEAIGKTRHRRNRKVLRLLRNSTKNV